MTTDAKASVKKVLYWAELNRKAKALAEEEKALRAELFDEYFKQKNGTQKQDLEEGWTLKAVAKENVKVAKELIPDLLEALRKAEVPCSDLFRYKPELSMTEYNKLSDEHKGWVDFVLTRTPGSPQITLERTNKNEYPEDAPTGTPPQVDQWEGEN